MDAGLSRGGPSPRIDVTPMADVMIVLLIIFMVVTPTIVAGGVRLPGARHGAEQPTRPALTLRAGGELALDDGAPLPSEWLKQALARRLEALPEGERLVTLRADRKSDYAGVRAALALCREAGAEGMALATVPDPGAQR